MKRIEEAHTEHTEIISEINFLKQEISFLLKLLQKAYSSSLYNDDVKILDAYWKEFERDKESLEGLQKKVQYEEQRLAARYRREGAQLFNENNEYVSIFKKICLDLRLLKESFYDFVESAERQGKRVLA